MNTEKTIVTVNGIKMEVDLRHATIVHENITVGTKVKVLAKGSYGGPEVYPGVVVGFEPFSDLPTIIVAYVINTFANCELKFAYVNSKSAEKWDLVPSVDDDMPIDKAKVIGAFDREIAKHESEIESVKAKRAYFLENFGRYFERAEFQAQA